MRSLTASAIGAALTTALVFPVTLPQAVAAVDTAPPADAAPGVADTRSLPLEPLAIEPRSADGTEPSESTEAQGLPATDVEPFSLLGVVWADPQAELHGDVQVRTRATDSGSWSDWAELETHNDHAPDPDSAEYSDRELRGATPPLWVGASDGVEVRVVPEDGPEPPTDTQDRQLPEGLRVDLIQPTGQESAVQELTGDEPPAAPLAEDGGVADPGPDQDGAELPPLTKSESEAEALALSGAMTAAADHVGPRPGITTRSGWGADEGLREGGFVYTDAVKTAFVHHTAATNNYTCQEVPSILRGIYQYHVSSLGWRDIGYNFFVDKCGQIYEGRAGGVNQPVLGAHTYGFNHNSMGVAVLGTFTSTEPTKEALDGVAKLTAWKLGLHGKNPSGSWNRVSGGGKYPKGTVIKMNNISGHRDGYATECPGGRLYQQLGTIRTTASRLQGR